MSWAVNADGNKDEVIKSIRENVAKCAPSSFANALAAIVGSMQEPPEGKAIHLYTYGHVDESTKYGEAHFKLEAVDKK